MELQLTQVFDTSENHIDGHTEVATEPLKYGLIFEKKQTTFALGVHKAGSRDTLLRPAPSRNVFKGQPGELRTVMTALSSFVPAVLLVRSLQFIKQLIITTEQAFYPQ